MMFFNHEDQYALCVKCGTCRTVCPVFHELNEEGASPRGKITLVQALIESRIEPSKRTKNFISECLLCTACVEVCPNHVQTDLVVLSAREKLADSAGNKLIEAALTKVVFAKTGISFKLGSIVEQAIGEKIDLESGIFYRLPANRIIPEIKSKKFSGSKKNTHTHETKTGFFLGCLIDFIYHDIAEDTVTLLEASGRTPYIPALQACCGLPALSMGDMKKAAKQAKAVMALFDTADSVVTACGSCGSMMKNYYKFLFNEPEDRKKAEEFAGKIKDITEVVDPGMFNNAETASGSVTYHDPCHLKRGMGIAEKPRALIARAGYKIKEMQNPGRCCGLGGAFNIKHRNLSSAITKEKTDDICSTTAATVATGCPGCMANISSMLIEQNLNIKVVHTVHLLAAALKKHTRA
jgi:glycolate oxidase iron-sulfur subunit